MKSPSKYKVIGLMSGTSLDGLDIVSCDFQIKNGKWNFKILDHATYKYNKYWYNKLSTAQLLSGQELIKLDFEYGVHLGKRCKEFIEINRIDKIDLIASHGHTIFHQPDKGFTYQMGNGNAIHAITQLPVVYDFRSLDVIRGGEGAPLVPIGDHLLFPQYDACINLGGIANISYTMGGSRVAFDVCFANMGLNFLAAKMNKPFDKNGMIASKGKVNEKLSKALNLVYKKWRMKRPSLGREGFEKHIVHLLNDKNIPIQNKMHTVCESICNEILLSLPKLSKTRLLVTGGGAFNTYLVSRLKEILGKRALVIVPDNSIVEFKEAMVFGFLGLRRLRQEVNVLRSVTGAKQDSCAGIIAGF